jgi:hypothetical protein
MLELIGGCSACQATGRMIFITTVAAQETSFMTRVVG